MRGVSGRVLALALGASFLATGCSNTKYTDQIEQQKLEISKLQERNYQLEMEMSRQKAQIDEANRRAAEAPPMDARGSMLGGETASVGWEGGGGRSGVSAGGERIVLDSEVLFSSGSANLTAKGVEAVKAVAAKIKKNYRGHQVRVEGHTDNVPIKKAKFSSNMELSQARAQSVANILTAQGISSELVSVEGFADSKPRASNSTSSGRAKNRRVEIVILQ